MIDLLAYLQAAVGGAYTIERELGGGGMSRYDLPFAAPGHLERARILERLGRGAEAAAEYRRFVELWQDCDPDLKPAVDSARAALGRLG